MAASIARRIIAKSGTSPFLAPSYFLVKPASIHNSHHPSLISSCLPNTTIASLLLIRSITTTSTSIPSSAVVSPPSSSTTRLSDSQSSYCTVVDTDWSPRLVGPLVPNYDPGHWICFLKTRGLEFTSGKEMLDCFTKTLAAVVGSVEEAKKKIYLASWEGCFCFGAQIDEQTTHKLEALPNVASVVKDHYIDARNKSPKAESKFAPLNWNHRLLNMDDYYKSSEGKTQGDSGHWLIKIKQPEGGLSSIQQALDWCFQFLAEFVGREEAENRIYIMWCSEPFGFGAQIDEGVAKRIQAQCNVRVLKDHAFDIKNQNGGVLVSTNVDGIPILNYWNVKRPSNYKNPDLNES